MLFACVFVCLYVVSGGKVKESGGCRFTANNWTICLELLWCFVSPFGESDNGEKMDSPPPEWPPMDSLACCYGSFKTFRFFRWRSSLILLLERCVPRRRFAAGRWVYVHSFLPLDLLLLLLPINAFVKSPVLISPFTFQHVKDEEEEDDAETVQSWKQLRSVKVLSEWHLVSSITTATIAWEIFFVGHSGDIDSNKRQRSSDKCFGSLVGKFPWSESWAKTSQISIYDVFF